MRSCLHSELGFTNISFCLNVIIVYLKIFMIFFAEFMNREVRSRINREKMKTEIEDFLL
jgi:hypothetical protein